MPRWQHFPLVSWLQERADVPVAMMNDANASVLAEAYWGAAVGADTAIFLTMSTGMGAGLLLGGRVFEGPLALAGEIGHIRLRDDGPVGFGKRGSVEGYLSGPGMVQVAEAEARIYTQTGRTTALADEEITPPRLCTLARRGDPAAVAAMDRIGDAVRAVDRPAQPRRHRHGNDRHRLPGPVRRSRPRGHRPGGHQPGGRPRPHRPVRPRRSRKPNRRRRRPPPPTRRSLVGAAVTQPEGNPSGGRRWDRPRPGSRSCSSSATPPTHRYRAGSRRPGGRRRSTSARRPRSSPRR